MNIYVSNMNLRYSCEYLLNMDLFIYQQQVYYLFSWYLYFIYSLWIIIK